MDEIKLIMSFENALGVKTVVNISGVRPDITNVEVEALANHIIDKSVLSHKGSNFAKYLGSEIQTIHTEAI